MARRILSSYVLLLAAFAGTMALGYYDTRRTAEDAELLRSALLPLQLQVGQLLAEQNVLMTQLNHASAAQNPGDVREWIESSRRARPRTLQSAVRNTKLITAKDPLTRALRDAVAAEFGQVESLQQDELLAYSKLFDLLASGDRLNAGKVQGELVKREAESASRLRNIKNALDDTFLRLSEQARVREQRSIRLLLGLSALTLLVGAALSLYARRVLRPLSAVTARAVSVAAGDLTPREVKHDSSEIGELAQTFETMVGAIRDAREEVVKTERLATVGKMAARITHEIRNPLSAIGLNLELLESELEEPGDDAREARELLSAIKGEAARLSRIAEQYLSMARKPVPSFAPESLEDLVCEIVAFLRPELERALVRVEVRAADDCPAVMLDEGLFRQAILNLIRNAREAMSEGGRIDISIEKAQGGGVFVLVEDEGPGIDETIRATIFDPFISTKEKGTGLGLAVTREIVEAHHGVIVCEPRGERGSRFRIHLPEIAAVPVPPAKVASAPQSTDSGTG